MRTITDKERGVKTTTTRHHESREEDSAIMEQHCATRVDATADGELRRDVFHRWMELCLPGIHESHAEQDGRPLPPTSESNSEILENVTQKETARVEKITEALNARSRLFARQGTVVAAWREHKGKRLGPYYRLVYRQGGRQKSIYLGPSAWVAEQVRAALAKLQTPLRETRRLQLARAMIRTSLRAHQSLAKSLFAHHGIHLKGFEYRGLIRHLRRMKEEGGRQNAECRMQNDE